MKLQLEVTYVDTVPNSVVFKPLNCSLQGDLVYKDLPRRAVEQFKIGQIVEATIPLPDHYPVGGKCDPCPYGAEPRLTLDNTRTLLSRILNNYPETKCFGALAGLECALDDIKARLRGNLDNHATSGADSLVQYAEAFYGMCYKTGHAQLVVYATELVKHCGELLREMHIEPRRLR